MPLLTIKLIGGTGYQDIAPEPGCCADKIHSKPQAYMLLDSVDGAWICKRQPILQGDTVTWNEEFKNIKCRDPESDQLHIYVVDGSFWPPKAGKGGSAINRNPPEAHFYGMYRMSVIQFERAKWETQRLVLQTKSGADTTRSITVQGMFCDDNIDDARIGVNQGAPGPPPPGPPPAAFAGSPPPGPPPGPPPVGHEPYPPPPGAGYGYPPAGDPAV
eukprot:TRINITY_DN743_c0_g1_i1.p1 TRINITY_DN743_c0_g1~~TRINITY_DN743_c0_g1_i1.p1  ORF type:complete len:248 (+),score=79.95 TRINITY_DN743_c0_g1_i1:97-744(+)